jgi:hypothetical protein
LLLELEDESTDNVNVSLVKTGIFDTLGDDISVELPRDYVTRNAVSQAEALDGSSSLVRAHVRKIIEGHSGNRTWMYGTISDCEWDEQVTMAIYFLATAEDDPLIPVKSPVGVWLVVDMYSFSRRLLNKASCVGKRQAQSANGLHHGFRPSELGR